MPMHQAALALADELGLTGRGVFFGDWVPYEEWPDYLLEADVGLSLHFDSIETRLAFRSRVLDYIWAGLPMVLTRGDAIGEYVVGRGLGEAVDYEDDAGVAYALLRLLERPRAAFAEQFEAARAGLTWESGAEPLVRFCRHPRRAPDKGRLPSAGGDCREQEMEIARLRDVIAGYESGRFIRFMRWVHRVGAVVRGRQHAD